MKLVYQESVYYQKQYTSMKITKKKQQFCTEVKMEKTTKTSKGDEVNANEK